jgi:hypothetical protein
MSKAFSIHAFVIAALLATAASAADSSESWAPWPFHHEEPAGKPERVTAYWNDAVATTAGQPAVRGFGGRLMFYESRSDTPVKVDGTLIVYAFDESNRDPNNCKPDCKYAFTPEQLPKHHSMTKAGHSYSVWLPWDQAGGMQKEITLIVRFEPKLGAPVIGDQLKEILPGTLPPFKADSATRLRAIGGPAGIMAGNLGNRASVTGGGWNGANPSAYYGQQGQATDGVHPISYEQPVQQYGAPAGQENRERRMMTATIDVPDGLALQQGLRAPAQPLPSRDPRPANGYPGVQSTPPGSGPTNAWPASNPGWRNGQASGPQMSPPQNLPPQAGSAPPRPWVPGEQYALPNPDRARWQPHPVVQPYAPANQSWGPNSNGAPAATTSAPQSQYQPGPIP